MIQGLVESRAAIDKLEARLNERLSLRELGEVSEQHREMYRWFRIAKPVSTVAAGALLAIATAVVIAYVQTLMGR